jgi:hypothetical protein
METGFLVLVIPVPGLDPGIASTGGVHGDPRIKSGDDDDGAVPPAESFSGGAVILMPMGTTLARVLARPASAMRRRQMFPVTVKMVSTSWLRRRWAESGLAAGAGISEAGYSPPGGQESSYHGETTRPAIWRFGHSGFAQCCPRDLDSIGFMAKPGTRHEFSSSDSG